jgi:hypothetical protein
LPEIEGDDFDCDNIHCYRRSIFSTLSPDINNTGLDHASYQ